MNHEFWELHYTCAEAGRKLGCSRQNVHQRMKLGSIPSVEGPDGVKGVPIQRVEEFAPKPVEIGSGE